jgi:hypothetical protein
MKGKEDTTVLEMRRNRFEAAQWEEKAYRT